MKKSLIILFVLMTGANLVLFTHNWFHNPAPPVVTVQTEPSTPLPVQPVKPQSYEISALPIEYINYSQIRELMQKWAKEAPEITEYAEYAKTSEGTPCTYLRIGTPGKPKVLIHSCLHGNERLSCAATMWIMQKMLHDYGRDPDITWLVDNREIYWIPALSPDTHLKSRHVEGRDPNRDYPYPGRREHTPTSPVKAIMDFHVKHGFQAVISGHTTGNIYFYPSIGSDADQTIHKEIASEMSKLSGYRNGKISGSPSGYEIDWYYWRGAVAILTEFGSGGHDQPTSAIEPHGKKNFPAYMYFIRVAPEKQKGLSPPK